MILPARSCRAPVAQQFAEEVVDRAEILDEESAQRLTEAFSAVPREDFLEEKYRHLACRDVPAPGAFQSMALRPSALARLIALSGIHSGSRVLEIGCSSGYSSAIMTSLGAQVYAIEPIWLLAQQTRRRWDTLGYQGILIRGGEWARGWREHATYDAIVFCMPVPGIPLDLVDQLDPDGGKLVAALGDSTHQQLVLWEKQSEKVHQYRLETCSIAGQE